MTPLHSDALVFFGATGDLAYKKIFPALQAMVKRGHLNVPVIGVSKAGWKLDQLKARARDSVEKHGGLDAPAFEKLSGLLRYVDASDDFDLPDSQSCPAHPLAGHRGRESRYACPPPGCRSINSSWASRTGKGFGARRSRGNRTTKLKSGHAHGKRYRS
jgi:glucose-6-phosphate 1-dehydrogenase